MVDLTGKTLSIIRDGHFNSALAPPLDFKGECGRLQSKLLEVKQVLSVADIDMDFAKRLLQGPLLDVTTHIGQIAMLNGLHGNRIAKQSYYSVDL
jgi:hypothetical protein